MIKKCQNIMARIVDATSIDITDKEKQLQRQKKWA